MAGYIGSKTSVTQVDGYNRTEADDEFVSKDGDTITTAAGTALTLDRTGSDGTILDLKKDGSTVGSIGVDSGDNITFGATSGGGSGLYMFGSGGTSPFILPMKEGALSDNTVTLGDDSRRFKDLYLSGGVYLGGTGSANFLSDYETGTWTPSFNTIIGATYTSQIGYYTKVGDVVTFHMRLRWSAGTSISGSVGGLPFAVKASALMYPMCSVWNNAGLTYGSGRTAPVAYPTVSTSNISIESLGSGVSPSAITFATAGEFYVTGHYYTAS